MGEHGHELATGDCGSLCGLGLGTESPNYKEVDIL